MMKRVVMRCLLLIGVLLIPLTVSARPAIAEILGVRLEMHQGEAHAVLKRIGSLERKERKRQEVWVLNDARFSHLLIGFDAESRVRYVTAIARSGGQRVRYEELGETGSAQRAVSPGHYKFTWEVASRRGQPGYLVVAHGRESQYLDSYSLKKLVQEETE
jgi:hypothetical protein